MQQRYCECGRLFYVAYVITEKKVRYLFKVKAKRQAPTHCPQCGKPVDINNLR